MVGFPLRQFFPAYEKVQKQLNYKDENTSGDLKKLRKIFGPPAILIRNFSYNVNHGALSDKYLQSIKVG